MATDPLFLTRLVAVFAIALIYTVFDLFNRRNVPGTYAYTTLAIGIVLTLAYLNIQTIAISFAIAAVIGSIGYLIYRAGQLGAADVIEFAAISLIIPFFSSPFLTSAPQLNLPFIIAVFIASGIVSLILIPFYYLPRADRMLKGQLAMMISGKDVFKGVLLSVAYLVFIAFMVLYLNVSVIGLVIIIVLMVSSLITAVFERPITDSMVEPIPVSKFEEGDIIALNLMKQSEINAMKRQVKGFDRLVTSKIIEEMKKKRITKKFPVYRSAMPLALPIFVGLVVSLLFGNVLLLII